jgi:RNA polymerase sigma-70 factor, ECF subfamily
VYIHCGFASLTVESERDEFVRLVDGHGAAVFGMLRRLCGNSTDAEDVFQETAIRVWRGLAAQREVRNPRAWLLTIAHRAFVDWKEQKRTPDDLWDTVDTRLEGPERQVIKMEEAQHVGLAIDRLTDRLREVVILHYSGGLTLHEIAEALGCSEGTIKSRLNAAFNKLRSMLP